MLAIVVFSTNFADLITLNSKTGYFANNDSLFSAAAKVLAISLDGFSLITVSFIIVFQFYSFGCGLYCGAAIFKWAKFFYSLAINFNLTFAQVGQF